MTAVCEWIDIHTVPLKAILKLTKEKGPLYRYIQFDGGPTVIAGALNFNRARYAAAYPALEERASHTYNDPMGKYWFEIDYEDIESRIIEWKSPFNYEAWNDWRIYKEYTKPSAEWRQWTLHPNCPEKFDYEVWKNYVSSFDYQDAKQKIKKDDNMFWGHTSIEGYTEKREQFQEHPAYAPVPQNPRGYSNSGAVAFSWSDRQNVPLDEITDIARQCPQLDVYRFDGGNQKVAYAVLCANDKDDALDAILDALPKLRETPRNELVKRVTNWKDIGKREDGVECFYL